MEVLNVGLFVGTEVSGGLDGAFVGFFDGAFVGFFDGAFVGSNGDDVGYLEDGSFVGWNDGVDVGSDVVSSQ